MSAAAAMGRRTLAVPPVLSDVALTGLCAVLTILGPAVGRGGPGPGGPGGPRGPDAVEASLAPLLLAAAVGAAGVLLRRCYPVGSWAVMSAVALGLMALLGGPTAAIAFAAVGLFTVAADRGLRPAVATLTLTTVAYLAVGVVVDGQLDERALAPLSLLAVATALGVAAGVQRATVRAAEQRAHDAELRRDREAARRVTEERLRIARELHDVVAHHVAVVNVQAGVARHLLALDPDQARAALDLVRSSSATAITELGAAVGLLRTAQDGEDGQDGVTAQPAPGLDRVPALVESLRRSGLDVEVALSGEPEPLQEVADLTAFRILQESLTNAWRHGDGTAQLRIEHLRDAVVVQVDNPVGVPSPTSRPPAPAEVPRDHGHGLIGMRERAQLVGAALEVGSVAGGSAFRVLARIPRGPR